MGGDIVGEKNEIHDKTGIIEISKELILKLSIFLVFVIISTVAYETYRHYNEKSACNSEAASVEAGVAGEVLRDSGSYLDGAK